MIENIKKINKKAKLAILAGLCALVFLTAIFSSLAFVYPANTPLSIGLGSQGNASYAAYKPKTKEIVVPYQKSAMASAEIAGMLSDASDAMVSYQNTLIEQQRAKVQTRSSQPNQGPAPQPAAISHADLTGYEAHVLAQINAIRAQHGLGPLIAVQSLTQVARSRSTDMLSRDYFSHYSPDGSNVFDYLRASGIAYSYGGENLAHSYPASAGSVDVFMNAWMASPGHRANILKAQYNKIGIGLAESGARRVLTTVFTN